MSVLEKMSTYTAFLRNLFWDESFWLPGNHTWADMRIATKRDGISLPQIEDLLLVPIPLAIFVHLIRHTLERYVWKPIGLYYGLRELKVIPFEKNIFLEKAYKMSKRPDNALIEKLALENSMPELHVARWFRKRRNYDKSSALTKFSESGWRLSFYLFAFLYGCVALWDKPWFRDTRECWYGAPLQHIDPIIYWYYMFEISYYLSAATSIFYDVKRKDFWEMFIHHLATIFLMCFSWLTNFVRVGSLVLIVHDAADYWLEGAKLAKYIHKNRICDVMFGIFTIVWFITRLVILPFRILRTSMLESAAILGHFRSYYIQNALLILLQGLHGVWFYLIMRIVLQLVCQGQIEGDSRSESEPSEESEEESTEKNAKNGDCRPLKGTFITSTTTTSNLKQRMSVPIKNGNFGMENSNM